MKTNKFLFFSFNVIHCYYIVNSQVCTDLGGRSGICVTLSRCSDKTGESLVFAKSTIHETVFPTLLSSSICGFDGTNFLICCRGVGKIEGTVINHSSLTFNEVSTFQRPPSGIFHFAALQEKESPEMSTQSLSYPKIIYDKILPTVTLEHSYFTSQSAGQMKRESACGTVRGKINRVVGGSEAEIGTFPWMAALGFEYELNDRIEFLSAGTLITRRHVLTAAHCIKSTLALVRLGAHNLSDPLELNAVNIGIKRTIVHEMFNLKSITNDIAIIELITAAPETEFIATICLPESNNFLTQDFVGMNPFLAGWGATKFRHTSEPILRVTQVPIVDRVICEESYKTISKDLIIDDKSICAGNLAADACQGDSGGPLMMPQWSGNVYKYYLLGIVSYGSECTRDGFPGVYTRVASYISWIKGHLQQ